MACKQHQNFTFEKLSSSKTEEVPEKSGPRLVTSNDAVPEENKKTGWRGFLGRIFEIKKDHTYFHRWRSW